jgi:hypothetical protein
MRITDPGEDAGSVNSFRKPDILANIKTQSRMTAPAEEEIVESGKITADVQSAKLKQLLGKIKTA